MNYYQLMVLLSAAIMLTGCGRLNSIYRPINVDSGEGALIGIKQRAILVSKSSPAQPQKSNTKSSGNPLTVCAEPSPDALSALAVALSGDHKKIDASLAFQESSAYVGLRTTSIQLLRDAMYRICEARMNGAVTDTGYALLLRRYQREIVALLAIEQLTGAVHSSTVIINSKIPKANPGDSNHNSGNTSSHKDQSGGAERGVAMTESEYEALAKVAQTVEHIANKILNVDDMDAFCFVGAANQSNSIKDVCSAYVDMLQNQYKAHSKIFDFLINITNNEQLPAQDKKVIIQDIWKMLHDDSFAIIKPQNHKGSKDE